MNRLSMLTRPRLDGVLDRRFELRVITVVAGAGFGKSTLIDQMLERNRAYPAGHDVHVPLRGSDGSTAGLIAALGRGFDVRLPMDASVESIIDAIWHRSPVEVAVVLDDVQVLQASDDAAGFVADLVDRAPENAHFVLVGRSELPMATARLVAAGQAARLDDGDLAFTGEEQTAFLALRSAGPVGEDLGGWPALLELAVAAGSTGAGGYVWEEVLDGFDPRRVRDLGRVHHLDRITPARLRALTGRAELGELLDALPLVSRLDDGAVMHALWSRVLGAVDLGWTSDDLDRAWRELVLSDEVSVAIDLIRAHGDEAAELELVAHYTATMAEHESSADLEYVLGQMSSAARRTPMGRLLSGRLLMRRDPVAAKPHLLQARTGFDGPGDEDTLVSVLGSLSTIAFIERDADALQEITEACEGLESDVATMTGAMAAATRAAVVGAPFDEVAEHLDRARATGRSLQGTDGIVAGVAARLLGTPELAEPYLDRAIREASETHRPLLLANRFDVSFLLGQIPDTLIELFDAGPEEGLAEMSHQATSVSGLMAYANAVYGRRRQARRHAERAEAYRHAVVREGRAGAILARMALGLLDGDDAAAAAAADELTPEMVEADLAAARGVPMAMIVSEAARARFEAVALGKTYELGRTAAAALLAMRERGDVAPAAALPWDTPERLRPFLVPSLVLELAVGATAGGALAADTVARDCAGLDREALRRVAEEAPGPAAKRAKELLKTVPARPSTPIVLSVLGPLELRRDGVVVDDPLLRRDRVRAMLLFLVEHRSCRREALGVALWPDFDEESMSNNLRVNLSHLHGLLEPERRRGEPAYLLRVAGDRVDLWFDEAIVLDVDVFEELVDAAEAADAAGDPARAVELHERAAEVYRGPYLDSAPDPAWGEAERARLRHRYVVARLRAGHLRLARGEAKVALHHANGVIAVDELNETALRLQVAAYLRLGDRSSARQALVRGLELIADEGFEPETETERLAVQLAVR